MNDKSARLFRINIEVGDLDRAARFYGDLLGQDVRIQPGSRFYLDAGGISLQVVQVGSPHIAAKALYFAVADLEDFHRRCTELGCLSSEQVHGMAAGEPAVRPWGERSFYGDDPWGNPLCFVDEGTIYKG